MPNFITNSKGVTPSGRNKQGRGG